MLAIPTNTPPLPYPTHTHTLPTLKKKEKKRTKPSPVPMFQTTMRLSGETLTTPCEGEDSTVCTGGLHRHREKKPEDEEFQVYAVHANQTREKQTGTNRKTIHLCTYSSTHMHIHIHTYIHTNTFSHISKNTQVHGDQNKNKMCECVCVCVVWRGLWWHKAIHTEDNS